MKKQPFLLVIMAAILAVGSLLAFVPAGQLLAEDTNWQASYWNNKTLSGTAVLQRTESAINYDWVDGSPHSSVNKDNFSARWTRTLNVPTAATYRFTATMDDGLRVWLDNTLIIDSWWDSQVHGMSKDVYLYPGDHTLKVEYYDAGGKAVAKLEWAIIGGNAGTPIGNWKGEYFNNTTLSGNPVLVRDDQSIQFDWGGGTPAWNVVAADQFSARWTRTQHFDDGKYRFTVQADDGVRLWVNGQLVVNQWHDSGAGYYTVDLDLPSGGIPIVMEYYENQGGAVAKLSWIKLSGNGQWYGEYFNNKNLTGSPVLTRNENQLSFNWGSGSPGTAVNSDNFSARWTRSMAFTAGRYRFTVTGDDGVRMWVNGQLIVNGWSDHQPQSFSGEIDLPNGTVPLQVEYYEATGGAQIQVSWTQISTSTLQPTPGNGTGTVLSYRLNVRIGPGLQYGIITTLSRGQVVNLSGYRSADAGWVQINMADGSKAWVSANSFYLQTSVPVANLPVWQGTVPNTGGPTAPTSGTGIIANAYYVNVRTGPGAGYPVITAVPAGQTVTLLGRNGSASWLKLRLANGTQGWMNASYVSSNTAFATLPVLGN